MFFAVYAQSTLTLPAGLMLNKGLIFSCPAVSAHFVLNAVIEYYEL